MWLEWSWFYLSMWREFWSIRIFHPTYYNISFKNGDMSQLELISVLPEKQERHQLFSVLFQMVRLWLLGCWQPFCYHEWRDCQYGQNGKTELKDGKIPSPDDMVWSCGSTRAWNYSLDFLAAQVQLHSKSLLRFKQLEINAKNHHECKTSVAGSYVSHLLSLYFSFLFYKITCSLWLS